MLSKHHKQYIIKHFVIAAALINAVINTAIGYMLFSGQEQIPVWGDPSLGVDIIATTFLLTAITSWLVGWSVGLALLYSRVEPIEAKGFGAAIVGRLPTGAWPRALLFGLVASCSIAPVVLYVLHVLAIQSLAPLSAVLFKTVFSVVLGLLLTPLVGVLALCDKPEK